MGILKHLLFWPVTGPSALARFSLEQVEKAAHRELTDEGRVQEDLMECQLLLELGEIDDDEYSRREAELMARLREVREWRERLGMQPTWGPMTVRREEGAGDPGPPDATDSSGDGTGSPVSGG